MSIWWYVGGVGPGNFSTIQDAVNASYDGDTIFVFNASSPYYGPVVIGKRLHIIGQDRNTTIVSVTSAAYDTFKIQSDDVILEGFWIRNVGLLRSGENCIINEHSNNLTIRDNIITGGFVGINIGDYQYHTRNIVVDSNIVSDCNTAMSLFESSNDVITSNKVFGNDYSIMLRSCSPVLFEKNAITENTHGMSMSAVRSATIARNRIENNSQGLSIYGWYDYNQNDNIIIENNTITNNTGVGIALSKVLAITIQRNNLSWNTDRALTISIGKQVSVLQNNILEKKSRFNYFDLLPSRNQVRFSENYWGDLHRPIKVIVGTWGKAIWGNYWGGKLYLQVPLVKFDLHPAHEPYPIDSR